MKLFVLQYLVNILVKYKFILYKLDFINWDLQVKTTLKLCPEEVCKGGVFMSDHWNRCYCGKCKLTLIKENAPKEPPKKKEVKKVVEEVEEKKPAKGKKGKK